MARAPDGPPRGMAAKEFRWLDTTPRRLQPDVCEVAGGEVATLNAPPVRVAQDGTGSAPRAHHLMVFLEGRGWCRTAATAEPLAPGDVLLLDDASPCEVVNPDGVRLLRWHLPAALLGPFLPEAVPLPLVLRDALAGLVGDHARTLARHGGRLGPAAQAALVTHLAGLVGIAVAARAEATLPKRIGERTELAQRILAHLLARACEHDLSPARAAADLGISPRWLHAVLRDAGYSFRGVVTGQRLAAGRRLLEDPAASHLSIAEIAFLVGFNDVSTFYRRFRDRYGTTPRAIRARACEPR